MSKRNLTDEDIEALVTALEKKSGHSCRFDNVSADDLGEAVTFYKNFNNIVSEGKTTARKTLVVITVTGAVGIAVAGAVVKLKQALLFK